jgi:hypothetical protein
MLGMSEDDLGIVDALAQLTFLVQGTLARRAAEYELSIIQMRLLGVLRDRTPAMNDLAKILEHQRRIGVLSGSVSPEPEGPSLPASHGSSRTTWPRSSATFRKPKGASCRVSRAASS